MANILNEVELNLSGTVYTLQMGGGSGVTSGEVQTMMEDYTYDKDTIDDKIASGASSSAVTVLSGDVISLSGDVVELSQDVQNISGDVIVLSGDVSALEGKLDALSGNVIDNERVVAEALNDLNDKKVESGDVIDIVSGFTYDKDTIDSKIASGGGESLLDAYEFFKVKNTYEQYFPSQTGATDWDDAIVDGIYIKPPLNHDPSYYYYLTIQVIDINGNRVSGFSYAMIDNVTSAINPLPDYIDIVYPAKTPTDRFLSLVLKPKEGYRMSKIEFYWMHDEEGFTGPETINEVEYYDEIPSGTTKDIIENYIEKLAVNAQHKFEVDGTYLIWQNFRQYKNAEDAFGKGTYYPDTLVIRVNNYDVRSGDTRLITSGVVYKELQKYQKSLTAGDGIDITNNVISVTGGGESSGITSGEVQTMIDESISGKVDDDDFIVVRDTVVDVVNEVNDINDDIASLSGDSGTLKQSAFTNAEYDSTNKVINFYNLTGGTVASIDATDFIKDGMIDSVSISGTDLIITFNTESGHEDIVISLADIFDPNNYYTKTEVNTLIQNKADVWCGSTSEWAQISGSTQPNKIYLVY